MATKRRGTLVDSYRPAKRIRGSKQSAPAPAIPYTDAPIKQTVTPSANRTATTSRIRPLATKDIFPFLSLPAEVRLRIYEFTVDWNEMNTSLSNLRKFAPGHAEVQSYQERCLQKCTVCGTFGKCEHPSIYSLLAPHCPRRSTPSMLLVCKQITREALHELHKKPLHLEWPYPTYASPVQYPLFSLPHFISGRTLRKVPELRITTSLFCTSVESIYGTSYEINGKYTSSSWIPLRNMLRHPDPNQRHQENVKAIHVRFRYHMNDSVPDRSERFAHLRGSIIQKWRENFVSGLDQGWEVVVGEDVVSNVRARLRCSPSCPTSLLL